MNYVDNLTSVYYFSHYTIYNYNWRKDIDACSSFCCHTRKRAYFGAFFVREFSFVFGAFSVKQNFRTSKNSNFILLNPFFVNLP
jgi:hypothetical protein